MKITKQHPLDKAGINEVQGLKVVMKALMKPVLNEIKEVIYWNDALDLEESEYTSRDGFIPYASNCGGIEISTIIPSIEQDCMPCLSFGECDVCGTEGCVDGAGEPIQCGYEGMECASECDGHLDAKLRVWFKFEGIDEQGEMSFYLYLGGGNGDAPYFRTKYEATVFESEFTAKTLKELATKGKTEIAKLIKAMKESA